MRRSLRLTLHIALLLCFLAQTACAAQPQSASTAQPSTRPATGPARFALEIAGYESRDRKTPPPQNAILFVGSSTFRMWKDQLTKDFEPLVTINRGFGGSTTADLLYYMDRIVLPYRPKAIVIYCGENDIASGKTPEVVLANTRTFIQRAQAALPGVRIWYVSMKPSPSRVKHWEAVKKGNQLIRDYLATVPNTAYIDTTQVMLDADGQPKGDLFLADRLHMNRKGYETWIPIIKSALGNP